MTQSGHASAVRCRDYHPALHAQICNRHPEQGNGLDLDGSGARSARRRLAVASRRNVRAQDELAFETARLKTAVCLGDLIERNPRGDARLDGVSCQQPEELPAWMRRPTRQFGLPL